MALPFDDHHAPLYGVGQVAEMLGVQRTTVTAVTGELQAKGLIRTHRGGVEVVDRPGLERAACECYAAVEEHFQRLLPEVAD